MVGLARRASKANSKRGMDLRPAAVAHRGNSAPISARFRKQPARDVRTTRAQGMVAPMSVLVIAVQDTQT